MDARWIPLLAAALGVLGGVGGAAVGGSVANSGQSQRLQEERISEIQDLLIVTYAEFQGAADDFILRLGIAETQSLKGREKLEFVEPQLSELYKTAAAVELVANSQVRDAADKIREELSSDDPKDYETLRDSFIQLAREEIEALQ